MLKTYHSFICAVNSIELYIRSAKITGRLAALRSFWDLMILRGYQRDDLEVPRVVEKDATYWYKVAHHIESQCDNCNCHRPIVLLELWVDPIVNGTDDKRAVEDDQDDKQLHALFLEGLFVFRSIIQLA